VAAEALRRIGELYAIEADIRGRLPQDRTRVRSTRTAPLLEELKVWLEAQLARVSKKSELAVAIRYALTHWGLSRYQ
jgi:transposase